MGGAPGSGPVLAEWGQRAQGALIDWIAPWFILGVVGGIINNGFVYSLFSLVMIAWFVYNMGYLGGTTGVTFGRRWAGTKLVRDDTFQPVGVGMAIVRVILHVLDNIIIFIGWLFPLFTPKKQTIADMIAKTVVIVDK